MTADDMLKLTDDISGWMTAEQRTWLYEQAKTLPPGGTWVEVGTWRGRSAMAVACGLPQGAWLYMVDTFVHDFGTIEPNPHAGIVFHSLAANVRAMMRLRPDLHFCVMVSESAEVALRFRCGSVHAVFLDGDHTHAGLLHDLRAWETVVKLAGLLCGHDLDAPEYPGVRQALVEAGIKFDSPCPVIWRRLS